jgi:RNA polymerase-interacting CarD/CdnL/TRCF family regulator
VARQSLDEAADWSRRYKANLQRLASGDRQQIADVVNGLSAGA